MNKVSVPIKELKHFIGCEIMVNGIYRTRLVGIRNETVIFSVYEGIEKEHSYKYTTVEFIKPIVKRIDSHIINQLILSNEFDKVITMIEGDYDVFGWLDLDIALDKSKI